MLAGVDTLELSTPYMLCSEVLTYLEEECQEAKRTGRPQEVQLHGVDMLLHPTPGKRGFSYRLENDELTLITRAKRNRIGMPNLILEFSSAFLNTHDWTNAYSMAREWLCAMLAQDERETESVELGPGDVKVDQAKLELLRTLGRHREADKMLRDVQEARVHGSVVQVPLPREPMGDDVFTISRVDLFVDVQGWAATLQDMICLCTPATMTRALFLKGRTCTGTRDHSGPWTDPENADFKIGKGNLVLRIYDKLRELPNMGKWWFLDLWARSPDYQEGGGVWRVEFQLRRPVLRQFQFTLHTDEGERQVRGVNTVPDLACAYGSLWRYLCGDKTVSGRGWASLKTPPRRMSLERLLDARMDRWAEHPAWTVIREHQVEETPITRTPTRKLRDADKLAPIWAGFTASMYSLLSFDQGGEVAEISRAIGGYRRAEDKIAPAYTRLIRGAAEQVGLNVDDMTPDELIGVLVSLLRRGGVITEGTIEQLLAEKLEAQRFSERLQHRRTQRGGFEESDG